MKKTTLLAGIAAFLLSILWNQAAAQSPIPSDAQIRKILEERLDKFQDRVGIIVGAIEPAGRRIIAVGSLGKDDKRPLTGDTVFEIGSITKVFTSLLLADMVQQGKLALADPVAKYLPANAKMPERGGRMITLESLARHRSGLPRLPANMAPKDIKNPYADYTEKQLYEFLSGYELPRDIDSQYEYSNLGGGLLGYALSLAAGKDYEALVKERIARPLGMNSTGIALSPEMKARLATGHDAMGEPIPNWDLAPCLAGGGALRSSLNDMLLFLSVELGEKKSSLDPAIALSRAKWTSAGQTMEIGLGWHKRSTKEGETIWHNGGTGGYFSFIGFNPNSKSGVVILTNWANPGGVDDIGFHLLDPEYPLKKSPKEIALNPKILDLYVGKYQFAPNVFIAISRKNNQMFAQLTGQGPLEIFPETNADFFARAVDARISFKLDSGGRANALVLHQMGREQLAARVDEKAAIEEQWFGHREKAVDPAIFKNYIGQYQLAPGAIITMMVKDNHLFTQLTGQPAFEVFPESERVFFLKVVDAQLMFESDGKGPASAVTLRQNGRETRAPRIAD